MSNDSREHVSVRRRQVLIGAASVSIGVASGSVATARTASFSGWALLGIAYRQSVFTKPPATWEIVLKEQSYAGRLGLPFDHPGLLDLAGWSFAESWNLHGHGVLQSALRGLTAQRAHALESEMDAVTNALERGRLDVAVMASTDFAQLAQRDADLRFVVPAAGTLALRSDTSQTSVRLSRATLDASCWRSHSPDEARCRIELLASASPLVLDAVSARYMTPARDKRTKSLILTGNN